METRVWCKADNMEVYTDSILDYEKFAQSKQFQDGVSKIKELVNQDLNSCLVCAEIDPINYHREILCGKELYANGLDVQQT